ncbi:hypothetical protein HPP92_022319 [Vanilla planifolia]|uniref:YqgF/RNase H-like domain-containing protein n=1 Tax=Vanilla planifolia TaxID=51239 RepID=A0A835UD39_VANPL|nr:hypothetical protein HPP92_022319 [Vanilla planifolia]
MLTTKPSILPAKSAALYPSNLSFITDLRVKHALGPCSTVARRLRVFSTSSTMANTGGGGEILPNALRRRIYPCWGGGFFSLGIDVGTSRTGVAIGKGFAPRPLTVLDLRGEKLEQRLIQIAEQEEVDEFIIGLPKSYDGKETPQSNKVRSIAGRIAVRAAERGLRIYLQDEHGTTLEALDFMIERGLKRSARKVKVDAYSAMMVLDRYFSTSGSEAELVLPKQLDLQEKLKKGVRR